MNDAWQAVMNAGVDVVPLDAEHVQLARDGQTAAARVYSFSRPLSPREVLDLVARHREPGLLMVPAATAAVRQVLDRAGWSWLVTSRGGVRGILRLSGLELPIGEERNVSPKPIRRRSGPVPWGSLTVVRRLLQEQATTQGALAASAGVSQPRVSQTLTVLSREGLVSRRNGRWAVDDFDGLLQRWLDTYPGPGGIATFWYGLDPLWDQARQVIDLLNTGVTAASGAARMPAVAVVSGDLAADVLAPWRMPMRAVLYARRGADLTGAGLTPAGAQEATLELILPKDPGIWPLDALASAGPTVASRPGADLPLADPVQILWDVRRAPGPDSGEAADRLWTVLREHRSVDDDSAS